MTLKHAFFQFLFAIAIAMGMMNSGCATDDGMGMGRTLSAIVDEPVRFSDTNNYVSMTNRNYKRMTRNRLEEESELHAQAGSMWVMEGQGAYLFAQNKSRKDGDLLNVKIDGPAQKQVEMKVNVIKTLLKQLEDQERSNLSQESKPENKKDGGSGSDGQKVADKEDSKREPASAKGSLNESSTAEAVTTVPTRIIEKLVDGNYRVKGQQPFMIGQREYKVIVTGVVRPEDFNDDGISSNRLLDPQIDVVNLRRTEKR